MRWLKLLLVALLFALVIRPSPVAAHPKIISIEPIPDSQLTRSPERIRIAFDEPIEAAFAQLRLYDAQAQAIDDGSGRRSEADPTVLELTPPPVTAGIYTVIWQIVGSDGHKVTGSFSFTILPSASTPLPAAETLPSPIPTTELAPTNPVAVLPEAIPPSLTLIALLRTLMLLGAMLVVGGWIWLYAVMRPTIPEALTREVIQHWRLVMQACVGVMCAATIGFLLLHTQQVAGSSDFPSLITVLEQTRLGQALGLRLLLVPILLGVLLLRVGRWQLISGTLTSAVLLMTFAVSGHASAQASPLLPIIADWIHLSATSVWVGGLAQLVLTLPRALRQQVQARQVQMVARVVQRFSSVALVSVASLVITGTYSATLHLTMLSDLWLTPYGQTLLAKLTVFGGLVALGAYQILVVRTQVTAWAQDLAEGLIIQRWHARFFQIVRGELVLAVLVLACVGLLTSIAPPDRQPARMTSQQPSLSPVMLAPTPPLPTPHLLPTRTPAPSVIFDQEQSTGDLRIRLRVEPASLGNNVLQIHVLDSAGLPLNVQKVVVFSTMTEMDMGETRVETVASKPGVYQVPKEWFSMVGKWTIRVSVRRIDADDLETTFIVPVGD